MDATAPTLAAPQADVQPSIDIGEDDFSSLRDAIRQAPENKQSDPVMKQEKPAEKPQKQDKPSEKQEKPAEDKPKSLKDKLKVEDEPVEEEAPEATDETGEDDIPTYKNRVPTEKEKATWKGLKQTKEEYEKLKPEFEKLKIENEELKKKPVLGDEILKKLERLEQKEKIFDLQGTEEYQKNIVSPLGEIDTAIAGMSKKYGINLQDLEKAFTETVDWERDDAIEKVLKQADEEVPLSIMKNILDKAARKHEIWKKEIEMFEDADRKRAAYEHEKKQTVTKQTLEEQKAWQSAVEASTQMIESQMGPLLKNLPKEQRDELMGALKEAKIADTPEDRALQAQAPHLAAVLIEQLNGARKELAELRKANKALSAAAPASNGRQQEAKKAAAEDMDDDEGLVKAIRGHYGR